MLSKSMLFLASLGMLFSSGTSSLSAAQPSQAASYSESSYTDLTTFDSTISYSISARSYSALYQSFTFLIMDDGNENYVLGNYSKAENYYPLTFFYTVQKADGTSEERTATGDQQSSDTYSYDAIGSSFSDETTFKGFADLPVGEGESVDYKTLKIVNIFHVTKTVSATGENHYSVDYSTNYVLKDPTLRATAKTNYNFGDFISDNSLKKVSSFAGFTSLICTYTSMIDEQYKLLSSSYTANKEHVDNGDYTIRMRFTSLVKSRLRVRYSDGSTSVSSIVGSTFLRVDHSGEFQFLLKDIKSEGILALDLLNVSVYADLYNNTIENGGNAIAKTSFNLRFGCLEFARPDGGTAQPLSYNLLMILVTLGVALLFVGAAFGYYFYLKNKYKNDEFNRVDPRNYRKRAFIAFFFTELATEEILFLIGRTVLFKNSLIVYNPFDPFIVAFSVVLIIYIGYYIKFFVGRVKDIRTKKETDKLKINDSVIDDGTGVAEKAKGAK